MVNLVDTPEVELLASALTLIDSLGDDMHGATAVVTLAMVIQFSRMTDESRPEALDDLVAMLRAMDWQTLQRLIDVGAVDGRD